MSGPELRLVVNGEPRSLPARPERTLLSALRDELGLTGTKYGCGEGECGACTVLLEGEAVKSCQVRIGEIGPRPVTTIEGLAVHGTLTRVQEAFLELGAFQCGFCTPGMVMRVTGLLRTTPRPTREELRTALEGNLCRCCGYGRILAASERAIELPGGPEARS
jgi:aerobic-type carbon monoxide dehydrogenase small subunit (CoxS/CutS family)